MGDEDGDGGGVNEVRLALYVTVQYFLEELGG